MLQVYELLNYCIDAALCDLYNGDGCLTKINQQNGVGVGSKKKDSRGSRKNCTLEQ